MNIIWDVDGTLFDTYPAIAAAFKSALREHGVEADTGWIMTLALQSIGHCVKTLAAEFHLTEAALEQTYLTHYERIDFSTQPPFAGVRRICERIRSASGRNVIVTHRGTPGTVGLLQAHEMIGLFTGWITRDDGYPKKPDPAAFVAALARFGLEPDRTIAVGDRAIDTLGAQRAGLYACQFVADRGRATADLLIQDYAELSRFLDAHLTER
jgi:HAD superfamily hydrolase (TIGR01549 family)